MAADVEVLSDDDLGVPVVRLSCDGPGGRPLVAEVAPDLGSNLFRLALGDLELVHCDRACCATATGPAASCCGPSPTASATSATSSPAASTRWPACSGGGATPRSSTASSTSSVENLGDGALPFGFALHPYFTLPSGPGRTTVTVPAAHVMEADEELLPSGRLLPTTDLGVDLRTPTPVAGLALDHVFTDLDPGAAPCLEHLDEGVRLALAATPDVTHVVLYTLGAAEGFVCLENQTGSTDMINLDARARRTGDEALARAAHLLVVPPGGVHRGALDWRVELTGGS